MRTRSTAAQQRTIQAVFRRRFGGGAAAVMGRMLFVDRVYELRCLIELIDQLQAHWPGLRFVLSSGTALRLRESGGPVDRTAYAFVEVQGPDGRALAEIWTNVEFWALSHVHGGAPAPAGAPRGCAHELDIVLLNPGVSGRPDPQDILIGVEAKHRPYGKGLLKELLGVRREMTFVSEPPGHNPWAWWSSGWLPARPASGLVAFCAYPSINDFTQAADFYGVHMKFLPL